MSRLCTFIATPDLAVVQVDFTGPNFSPNYLPKDGSERSLANFFKI